MKVLLLPILSLNLPQKGLKKIHAKAEIEKISPDRVFIILHGKGGEDGEIQKYLDSLNIPYTGSNSESSKLCMNKRSTKEILLSNDILTPNYENISEMEISLIKKRFQYPFIVKPSAEGSSIGVYIVENDSDLERAISANEKISSDFIAEDYIMAGNFNSID